MNDLAGRSAIVMGGALGDATRDPPPHDARFLMCARKCCAA